MINLLFLTKQEVMIMFDVKGLEIQMYEGDFGEQLPINIVKGEVLEGDVLKFIIQDKRHNDIINKEVQFSNNSFIFSLTENETKLLFIKISKCKCGPVELPVEPDFEII